MPPARRAFGSVYERTLLRNGFNVTVRVTGANATLLHIDWPLCSKSALFQITDGDDGEKLRDLGFKRVECADGYEGTWGVTF